MGKNYCIFRTAKLKSHNDVVLVLKEQHRAEDYDSKRADKTLSFRNSYSSDYDQAQVLYDELLPKKIRKNAVVGLNFLVSTSQEFLSAEDEKTYYQKARDFISERFGKVVGWAIHRDETSTHMQVVTIPLVDGKLNARELIGGDKHRLQKIQDDFFEQVGKPFGLERGEENSQAKHKTVEQFHKEKERELNEKARLLDEREKSLSERENGLVERSNALFDKETRLNVRERDIDEKGRILSENVTAINENVAKLNEAIPKRNFDTLLNLSQKVIAGFSTFCKSLNDKLEKWLSLSPFELRQRADKIERANCQNWKQFQQEEKRKQKRDLDWER